MTAATKIMTCGSPEVVWGKPKFSENQVGWDEISQTVKVFDQPSRSAAEFAAGIGMHSAHPTQPNFYQVDSSDCKLCWDTTSWEFNLTYRGALDLNRRHRAPTTQHGNITWEEEQSGLTSSIKVKYEILIPRMTVVDTYFTSFTPNWSQQGNVVLLPSAPFPPTLPPWSTTNTVKHIPYGWVLTSREGDPVGGFPGTLWLVTDTVTYFEESRPDST